MIRAALILLTLTACQTTVDQEAPAMMDFVVETTGLDPAPLPTVKVAPDLIAAGMYETRTRTIWLRSKNLENDLQRGVLVHELTHYLQDVNGMARICNLWERQAFWVHHEWLKEKTDTHISDERMKHWADLSIERFC